MKTRTLTSVNDKLKSAHAREDAILDRLDLGHSVSVLEVGFGQGRALFGARVATAAGKRQLPNC